MSYYRYEDFCFLCKLSYLNNVSHFPLKLVSIYVIYYCLCNYELCSKSRNHI